MNNRRFFFIIIFFLIFAGCKFDSNSKNNKTESPEVENLKACSNDSNITLTWTLPAAASQIEKILIEYDDKKVELGADKKSYTITNGTHGQYFQFKVCTVDKAGKSSNGVKENAVFTVYSEFENPVMLIDVPGHLEITKKKWLKKQNIDLADCTIVEKAAEPKSFKIDIKGRGNSSWLMPKKCYSIKLDKKDNLFGMANGPHKNYALIANYADKTLMRNQLAYYMGNEVFDSMSWSPHTKVVNVFINGSYRGLYMLTERVKIHENEIDIPQGGWIVEANKRFDEAHNWISENTVCFSLKDPEDSEDWQSIKDYINEVESVLYDDAIFTDAENGWRKYLDEASFIDWYLVNEIAKNPDANWFSSCFMYFNPSDNKLHMGPLWDFDIGFGNINYTS